MGLRAGMRLLVESDRTYEAIYLPGAENDVLREILYGKESFEVRNVAFLRRSKPAGSEMLSIREPFEDIAKRGQTEYFVALGEPIDREIRVTVQPAPVFPAPDPAALDDWHVEDKTLNTRIITSAARVITLAADPRVFNELGVAIGDPLLLDTGHVQRTLHFRSEFRTVSEVREITERHRIRHPSEDPDAAQILRGGLRRHWEFRNKHVLWVETLEGDKPLNIKVKPGERVTLRRRK
jgi:hypothetical protein